MSAKSKLKVTKRGIMIHVKIELWPHGIDCQARTLGLIKIWNDLSGTKKLGNYKYFLRLLVRFGHVLAHLCKLLCYNSQTVLLLGF